MNTTPTLSGRVERFNQRDEILWFGLYGVVGDNSQACVRFSDLKNGVLGGGGTRAVNGGVIAAGFDAACVLAALTQYETDVVLTLTMNVQFLRLALASPGLEFRAIVTKRSSQLCFVAAELIDGSAQASQPLAMAQATLAPRREAG